LYRTIRPGNLSSVLDGRSFRCCPLSLTYHVFDLVRPDAGQAAGVYAHWVVMVRQQEESWLDRSW